MSCGWRDQEKGPARDPGYPGFLRGCAAAAGFRTPGPRARSRCPGAGSAPQAGRGSWPPTVAGKTCRGAVTAEFAVALPAVLLLLALLLAGSAAGVTQLRLEEAARAGARALARGEDAAAVGAIVRRLAGDSAASAVAFDGDWLSVTVSGRVPGTVGSLLPWTLSARAWARGEAAETSARAQARKLQERQPLRQAA